MTKFLYEIDSSKLKQVEGRNVYWFKGDGTELYIVAKDHQIERFNIVSHDVSIRVGPCGTGQVERIDNYQFTENESGMNTLKPKVSSLLKSEREISSEDKEIALDIIHRCLGLKESLKSALIEYFSD